MGVLPHVRHRLSKVTALDSERRRLRPPVTLHVNSRHHYWGQQGWGRLGNTSSPFPPQQTPRAYFLHLAHHATAHTALLARHGCREDSANLIMTLLAGDAGLSITLKSPQSSPDWVSGERGGGSSSSMIHRGGSVGWGSKGAQYAAALAGDAGL